MSLSETELEGGGSGPSGAVTRRHLLQRGSLLAGAAVVGAAAYGEPAGEARTSAQAPTFEGQPVPEPPPDKSAGPIRPGRGSTLTGKVAVVTGAARGIGRAIAVEFAANGADVLALDIAGPVARASDAQPATMAELDDTVRRIREFGRRSEALRVDIRDMQALRAAAAHVQGTYGRCDVLVANAAIQYWKPLLELEDREWSDVIENNLNGTANTLRAFAPSMVARRHGRIIVVSSMQGKHGTKHAASYSASKWGILGLMKSAALEFGEHGITVNALIPGLVDTPLTRYTKRYRESMGETGQAARGDPTPQQAWDLRAKTVALRVGWLQPEDISPAAVFLASDAAAMVTGAEYEVTAGDSAKDI